MEDEEYSLTEQGVSKTPAGQYMLTEKGHDAVDEMIAFPEIEAENYKQLINKKFFSKRALTRHKLGLHNRWRSRWILHFILRRRISQHYFSNPF